VFYDLGSGSGKGVIAAHYLAPFTRCIGIELLTGLYDLSQEVATKVQNDSAFWKNNTQTAKGQIEMIHGDILKHDWYHFISCASHRLCTMQ
jgi:predicted RNA methylase